ncbi:hypothetical protein MBLNU457_7101t2 [Dothideomycetes sp. NU457]
MSSSILFPYALKALPEVLSTKWDDETFRPYREAFPAEARTSPQAMEEHVKDLTARDVKISYLKNLQGYLWQSGYEDGVYSTPLFDDVEPRLRHWKAASTRISIYSSGSVFAQKLLFRHVASSSSATSGASSSVSEKSVSKTSTVNLETLISDWFDTTNAGMKMEKGSYEKIASEMGRRAERVLFLSDNVKEVRAAREAGMRALLVERPGNAPVSQEERRELGAVESLAEVEIR